MKANPKKPTCHLCRKRTTDEHFCFGCQSHICHKCDINMCTGSHAPVDHIRQMPGEFHGS